METISADGSRVLPPRNRADSGAPTLARSPPTLGACGATGCLARGASRPQQWLNVAYTNHCITPAEGARRAALAADEAVAALAASACLGCAAGGHTCVLPSSARWHCQRLPTASHAAANDPPLALVLDLAEAAGPGSLAIPGVQTSAFREWGVPWGPHIYIVSCGFLDYITLEKEAHLSDTFNICC